MREKVRDEFEMFFLNKVRESRIGGKRMIKVREIGYGLIY